MEHLRYFEENRSWTKASKKCKSLNGSLLTITMETEEALLRCSLIESNTTLTWTGLIQATSKWIEMKGSKSTKHLTIALICSNHYVDSLIH